jgi:hypothetical protein
MLQQQERADKPILSVESGGPADVALRGSALVRWLCVTGFSRVCPSISCPSALLEADNFILSNGQLIQMGGVGYGRNASITAPGLRSITLSKA